MNASSFHGRMVGPGGFIDITQNVRKLCFIGTFTAGKQQVELTADGVQVVTQGPQKKFRKDVEAITFSGQEAVKKGQEVLYITERAVFRLEKAGITLVEIARGVDLRRDILDQMEFRPVISENLKSMPPEIFQEKWGGLKGKRWKI